MMEAHETDRLFFRRNVGIAAALETDRFFSGVTLESQAWPRSGAFVFFLR